MKKLFAIVSILLLTISLNAQEVCGFDSVLTIQKNSNPEFINQINQVNEALNYYIESKKNNQSILSISNTAEYVIPVVVHIVRDPSDAISVISYAQIESQIDALNAAFSKGYPTYNGNSNGPNAVDTKIQFCLAKNPTGPANWTNSIEPGVMRYDDALRSHNQMTIASTDDLLSLTHPTGWFPFSKYLNIWVVQSIDGLCASSQTQGYSVLPLYPQVGINGFTIDGVVIRGDAFGDNSTGNSFTLQPHNSYGSCVSAFAVRNQGKVLVHEIGHYLNLFHTFQPDIVTGAICSGSTPTTCMNEGDYICDTPPSNQTSTYTCGQSIPSSCGVPEMVENFMAYSQDPCQNTFTQNQTERITAYLDLFRPELSSLDNQIYTGIRGTGGCIPPELIASFSFTGTNCINTPITFNSVAAPANSATTFAWSSTGGTIGSPTSANTTITFTSPGSYTVTLTVDDGSGAISSNQIIGISACQLNPNYIHNAQWYYGQYATVDFTSGVPVPTNTARVNETVYGAEGAYSYSDDNGNLVFYTDGINLWNNLHQQINTTQIFPTAAFGFNTTTSLSQATTSTNGLTGISFPGHPNEFFLFSAAAQEDLTPTDGFVRWVNVNLNTGMISPAQNLTPIGMRMAESLTIIPHCNGQDYWLVCHERGNVTNNNRFYTYLLSSLGLSTTPNISGTFTHRAYSISEMKGSPDNTKIVLTGGLAGNPTTNDVALYEFNNLTGTISNEQIFDMPGLHQFYGCSFSPNSQQVYTSSNSPSRLVQFDVATGNGIIIPIGFSSVRYLQLGPDDNIYVSEDNFNSVITGQIVNPNIPSNIGAYSPIIIDFSTVSPLGIITKAAVPHFMDGIQPNFTPADFTLAYTSCSEVNFTLDACWSAYDATWNFGDATPVVSGDNVIHTYSSPGTYTVTCSLTLPGLTGSIDVQHQVTILNTSATITGPSSVCLNDQNPSTYSVPFISGSTYNWTVSGNGTIVGPNGGSQINVDWSSGSTGTVSVSITSGGCFSSGVLNITINPQPTITATANPIVVCPPGSPVTLTASGASSYLWVFGSSTVSGNPITDNPTSTTSYTVVGTDNNGCQASTIISVTVDATCIPTDCTVKPNITLPNGASSTFVSIPNGSLVEVLGLFTIDNLATYTNVKFRMAAGAQIDIASGSSLTLKGCHVFSCTQLWKEITVNPNAKLYVNSYSIIEDAEQAVHWINGGDVTLNSSIFNRNGAGLVLQGANAAPNVVVSNTIFTCRNFPNSLYSTSFNAGSFTTLKNELFNDNLSLYPYGSLIAPAPANTRSLYGVYTNEVSATIGVSGIAKNRNLFDYLDFGVYVNFNADMIIVNNSFANLSGYSIKGSLKGVGVLAKTKPDFTMTIGGNSTKDGNYFKNCYRGANITGYNTINFINNSITNTSTSPVFNTPVPHIGHYGLAIFNSGGGGIGTSVNYVIRNNSIDNNETGIYINGVYSLIQNNFVQITNNQMDVTGTGTYSNRGVWIQNMAGSQAVNGDVFVSGNTIENCEINAMLFENLNNMLRVDGNLPSVTPTPTLQTKEVVRLNSCANATVLNNTITTTNNTTIPSGTLSNFISGIYMNNCQSSLISCNTILYVDACVAFVQPNSMSQFSANDMNYAQYGLVLANGAIIGQQGDATNPSGNKWGRNDANNITLNHTYTFNTLNANTNSPLYCKPNTGLPNCSGGPLFKTFPCSNSSNLLSQEYLAGSGLFNATGPSPDCTVKPGNPKANALALLQEATNGSGSNVDKFLHKSQAFHLIKTDQTGVLLADPTLSTFYQQEQVQNIGKLSTTNELVVANDYVTAKNTINNLAPTNIAESNFKIAYDVWLDLLLDSNYVLNTSDSLQLVIVANMCIQEGGDATIMARTLLANFTQNAVNYVDCFELPFGDAANRISETSSFDEKKIESFGFSQEVKINLYPNPNNGSFRVTHNLPLENNVYIEVMDITGKIVHRELLTTGSQQVVKTQQLNTGLYFVNFISDSGELMYSTKMSILHE